MERNWSEVLDQIYNVEGSRYFLCIEHLEKMEKELLIAARDLMYKLLQFCHSRQYIWQFVYKELDMWKYWERYGILGHEQTICEDIDTINSVIIEMNRKEFNANRQG